MSDVAIVDIFTEFALAAVLGFLIGLERQMSSQEENPHTGLRDFILFALMGALSAFIANILDQMWIIAIGFGGFLALLFTGYWADFFRNGHHHARAAGSSEAAEAGITTEAAAILTFLLGILVIDGSSAIAVAVAILVLMVLSQARTISKFQHKVQRFELEAALKLLVITFIVLPVLPNQPLDEIATLPLGRVEQVDAGNRQVTIELTGGQHVAQGEQLMLYSERGPALGELTVLQASRFQVTGRIEGEGFNRLAKGVGVRTNLGVEFIAVMLSAINPYKVWLIVILVSAISFVGYVLVKVFGSGAGIGLTGLVGGLASSTVTTLSFARRSKETPQLNRLFAIAVILASTVMFPRLLMQIAVVNQALSGRMLLPVAVMAVTGILVAIWYYLRNRESNPEAGNLALSNPFSLKSAIAFAAVFSLILMVTRLAITYLGDAWLPVVALVSGLTDADAIAFSVSDAQQAGLISMDWAAFNVVLGAVANTFMKLLLVLTLGDRGLFRKLLLAMSVIVAAGLASAFLYYDFSTFDLAAG
ncbi:MAG TPA: MgtC/SapB family protein [Sedimenticola sp.]|nr:MgtC/SapB family protein [Sedimenticola sp.]